MANITSNSGVKLAKTLIILLMVVIMLIVMYYIISKYYTDIKILDNDKCDTHNNNDTKSVENDTNTKEQVFNLSNNIYNYNDARAVCNAHGAKLATLQQMIEAHKKGADWCNYGWSEEQMALYPTQKDKWDNLQKNPLRKNECGKPGVNGGYFHNTDLKFGANCYGIKPTPKPDEREKMRSMSYLLNPLELKTDMYKQTLDTIKVSPFNRSKWSQFQ